MPNRVVKEGIIRSEKINSISWTAEIFFRRLMSVADDFGRYDGRPSIIRSAIYPLRLDKVSEADVVKWMDECSKAELISLYTVKSKPYLEIIEFGQTIRIKKEKYPCKQMQADASRCMSETNPNPNPIQSEITEKTFFRIRGNPVMDKVSVYFKNNFQIFLEQWQMTNGKDLTESVLKELDNSKAGYSFSDENHLQNTFTSTWKKFKEGKKEVIKPISYPKLNNG